VKLSKFNESGQLLAFYVVSVLWGADIIFRQVKFGFQSSFLYYFKALLPLSTMKGFVCFNINCNFHMFQREFANQHFFIMGRVPSLSYGLHEQILLHSSTFILASLLP